MNFTRFGGRMFVFVIVSFSVGATAMFLGKLTGEYIALVTALGGLLTFRAVAADKIAGDTTVASEKVSASVAGARISAAVETQAIVSEAAVSISEQDGKKK